MAETTIEWTRGPKGEQGYTFNPWEGCQEAGPGCDNCYAKARNARFGGGVAANWGPGAPRRRTSASNWAKPLKWNADAAANGERYRVFCASLADVFDNQVPTEWRADLFALIRATPHLDWLLLTKRIGNAAAMIESALDAQPELQWKWPWFHVWIGATICNQEEADRDIPKLLAVPAQIHFLSMEPLLGPVDLTKLQAHKGALAQTLSGPINVLGGHALPNGFLGQRLDWVIAGGESGPGARPSHPEWFRSLRDQCAAAGVPFLFKQWGDWLHATHFTDELNAKTEPFGNDWPNALWEEDATEWRFGLDDYTCNGGGTWMCRVGKKAAGRMLDGRTWDGFPEAI